MFQITKQADRPQYSLLLPAAPNALIFAETIIVSSLSNPNGIAGIARGIAFQEDTAIAAANGQAATVKRADGTGPIVGFITRAALVGGPTLADAVMPNRTALPFQDGQAASFEYAEEFIAGNYAAAGQADGYDHICVAGTGALAANTPLNTPLSFTGGKVCKAVAGQIAEYALVSVTEAPLDKPDNAFVIRARRLPGAIKA